MRLPLSLIAVILVLFSTTSIADEGHHHKLTAEEVGSVHFATSCSKAVADDFNRSVALLHSFQYEQARAAFQAVAEKDPKCAMAQWGIAMSHYHGLWDSGDMDAGRVAIQKAGQIAASNRKTTTRERDYIAALSEIYAQDGKDKYAHALAYEQKMSALHAANPDDSEAAIFHALALAITAPKTDKTFANQRKCGEILMPLFEKYPHHPGIAHYIIHCYDNPVLANDGLKAARAYAKIAPASAHANHMPSHIFTRVGSWQESIDSNARSAALAAEAEKTSTNGEARDQRLHAMDYLAYAYLQIGRDREAEAVLNELRSLPPVKGLTLTGNYSTEAIPARYTIERGDWKAASELQADVTTVPWAQALTWLAVGEGAARSGNLDRARLAEKTLSDLRDKTNELKNTYWANQIEVQRREVAAWILEADAKHDGAIAGMRSAAELEESMDKNAITPGAITPAREMLAQLLEMNGKPKEALGEYEAVLKIAPNRLDALTGARDAAKEAGDEASYKTYRDKVFNQLGTGE